MLQRFPRGDEAEETGPEMDVFVGVAVITIVMLFILYRLLWRAFEMHRELGKKLDETLLEKWKSEGKVYYLLKENSRLRHELLQRRRSARALFLEKHRLLDSRDEWTTQLTPFLRGERTDKVGPEPIEGANDWEPHKSDSSDEKP